MATVPIVACLVGGANDARRVAVVGGAGALAVAGAAIDALGFVAVALTVRLAVVVVVAGGLAAVVALDAGARVVPGPKVPELIT